VASGRVQVLTGAACIGQGLASVLLQIVCAITALKPEGIEVVLADTERTLDSGATTASRQTLFTGEAVRQAAEKLAADLTQAELHHLEGREYRGEYRGITDSLRSTKEAPVTHVSYSFGTQVVLLDEVGKVKKVIAAYDVGRAINPTLLEGQIEGGILMGLGYALTEDFPLEECIPKCKTLGKLGLWRTTDVPEISITLIEKNLAEHKWKCDNIVAGAITLVYQQVRNDIRAHSAEIQSSYRDVVLSSQFFHLTESNSLEIVAVKGPSHRLTVLSDKLIAIKGIQHGKLVMSKAD